MLTDSQVKKQLFWTNGCFRAAMLEHYDSILSQKEKRFALPELKYLLYKERGLRIDDPILHALYLKKLLALSSERLQLIVECFYSGQQYRAQTTIDAITTELFERSVSETRENT